MKETEVVAAASTRAVPTTAWEFARTSRIVELSRGGECFLAHELNLAARLDWGVYQTPAFFFVGTEPESQIAYDGEGITGAVPTDGHWKLVARRGKGAATPAYYVNVRDDRRQVVGIVKKRYRVLQNDEAPRFLDQLVGSGDATWEVAGALHGGAQIFWLMNLGPLISIAGDCNESIQMHLLLTNSHDGSTSLTIAAIASRPQSHTTLAYTLPAATRVMKVKHTDSARNGTIEARRALELGQSYQCKLIEFAQQMIDVPLNDSEFYSFVEAILPTPHPRRRGKRVVNQRGVTMAENTKGLITAIYYNNEALQGIRGTLWGAVLACQFVTDHLAISRNTDDASADENRFKRLTSGSNLGNTAFLSALRLLSR